jgi:glycosyltransferase involved in cell wall biosynthesis
MSTKKIKVFHGPVNYGTQAGLLSKALRENHNISALSVSYPDTYKRQIDIQLKSGGNTIEKVFKHTWNRIFLISCFFKYNTFHFYFGKSLLNNQRDLPFYKFFNKKVVMHYLGNDVELYRWSIDNYEISNMRNMMTPEKGKQHDSKVLKRMRSESKYIDHKIVCAPQYSPFVQDSEIIPLAVDLSNFSYTKPIEFIDELNILHAPTSRKKKGTEFLVQAVSKLKEEGYKINLDICENITHDELRERYKKCHVSVVALMGGWYGTAGVEAMAIGRPIITFIRPSLFNYIDIKEEELPIISANKDDIYEVLKDVVDKKYDLNKLSLDSHKFVNEFHNPKMISKRLIEIYRNI